jgi:hypothetical protein
MNNLIEINDERIQTLIDNVHDSRVIFLMAYSNSIDCKRARQHFEGASIVNSSSLFCVVDTDKFNGRLVYVEKNMGIPTFYAYYKGKYLNRIITSDFLQITNFFHVMIKSISENQFNTHVQQPVQMQQPVQIQQPVQMQQPVQQPVQMQPSIQQPIHSHTQQSNNLPDINQLQQYFELFIMMDKMGILNKNASVATNNNEILLDNGDVIVPLENGEFGVIEKK